MGATPQPRYTQSTTTIATRVPEPTRRIVDWLCATTGVPSPSEYLRRVLEQHLRDLGFQLTPGVTEALPSPSAADMAAWQQEHGGSKPDRTVG
jgi:hypothetical protein